MKILIVDNCIRLNLIIFNVEHGTDIGKDNQCNEHNGN